MRNGCSREGVALAGCPDEWIDVPGKRKEPLWGVCVLHRWRVRLSACSGAGTAGQEADHGEDRPPRTTRRHVAHHSSLETTWCGCMVCSPFWGNHMTASVPSW